MRQDWNKEKAETFTSMVDFIIPERRTQFAIVADLLPFAASDSFSFIDISCGEGFLSQAILDQYPGSICHATDVAEDMIIKAQNLLGSFGDRVTISKHNIHDAGYLSSIVSGAVGVITSSLAIHHCNGEEKAVLYKAAFEKLTIPGAMIIIDVVKPASDHGIEINKKYWQLHIRQQSRELTGSDTAYEKYKHVPIMFYDQPEDEDQPSTLVDNLSMLKEAGFTGVDCFWKKCGFTIFGGYKQVFSK